jgi:hypothetical protein
MSNKRNKPKPDAELKNKEILQRDEKKKPVEIISLDMDEEGEEPLELEAEITLALLQDAQEENYGKEIARYTDDTLIQESLEERQQLNTGSDELQERLAEHHAKSPTLSGGDIDAAWDDANVGEETVGGMAPTPDQDDVEEIGQAYGIEYEDDEPLRTGDKLAQRDEERWELNPESAEESD